MANHKGIDDLLAAGLKPQRLTGGEVPAFFAKIRTQLFGGTQAEDPAAPPLVASPTDRPAFPIGVFPAMVARFARRVAAAIRCPLDFLGLAILVISGAAIGAARSLQVKGGWHEKPNLYAVIVSRPGTAKTPALRAVMAPIYEQQDTLYEDFKAATKKYLEDLDKYKHRKQNAEEDTPTPEPPAKPPPLRHLFANDTTVEGLAANLEENRKGILLFRDELTAWVRSLDQYKGRGTDRQAFLSAWSGEMIKVDRKSTQAKPIIIAHPFIAVLGGIQPDLLTELESEGGKEDGFIHRILFSYPPESQVEEWSEDEISEEDELEWRLVLSRLLNLQLVKPEGGSERPRRLQFSPEGKQAYVTWHNALVVQMKDDDFPSVLFGPYSKLKAHCARFALILHLLRVACGEAGDEHGEGQVDAQDVAGAAQLCSYFQAHFKLVYSRLQQSQEDKQVDELVSWMHRKKLTRITLRDVCRANVCGIKKTSEAEKLLKAAADRGLGDAEGGDSRNRRRGPEVQAFALKGT